jgi:hypothetical protein
MTVWFMRRLHCGDAIQTVDGIAITFGNDVVASLRCEEFTLFRAGSPPALKEWEHQQMIVETTCCARESVRMRCTTEAR